MKKIEIEKYCLLCGKKIETEHPQNKDLYAPNDSMYLTPALFCFHCKTLHKKREFRILSIKGKIGFFIKRGKIIFIGTKEIIEKSFSLNGKIGFSIQNRVVYINRQLFENFLSKQ